MADEFSPGDPEELIDETPAEDGLFDDAADDFDAFEDGLEGDEDAELIVEPEPVTLGRAIVLDFNNGGVKLSGRGPMEVRGEASLRLWIEKCLRTHEGAHPIHPEGYGLERPIMDYIGLPEAEMVTGDLEEDIRDALIYHPSINDIENFELAVEDGEGEPYALITFDVIRDDGTREDFDLTLNTGEVLA